jgi:hypothetical protein
VTNSITTEAWDLAPVGNADGAALVASGDAMLDVLGASPSSPFHRSLNPCFWV